MKIILAIEDLPWGGGPSSPVPFKNLLLFRTLPQKHQLTAQQQSNLLDVNHLTSERGVVG